MSEIPHHIRAILDALQFSAPRPESLAGLPEERWPDVLAFCDRHQLTLPLLLRCGQWLPLDICRRIEKNLAANRVRFAKTLSSYQEAAAALQRTGIPFVVLKGFTQWPWFAPAPEQRVQYDIDLYCPHEHVHAAQDVLVTLGYESLRGYERQPTDHLPVLVKKSAWRWEGDYFDTGIPTRIELHFRFWDSQTERFEPSGLEAFWTRRVVDSCGAYSYPALHPADRVGYACLHLLRHVLRGDAKPYHAYEIAWLLDQHAEDLEFWRTWRDLHDDSLRRLETIVFALCERWFGCRLPDLIAEEAASLPSDIRHWIEAHALAPLEALVEPGKHELWLHLALLRSTRDRLAIAGRRLFPTSMPGPAEAPPIAGKDTGIVSQLQRRTRYATHVVRRALHHARALLPTLLSGVTWYVGRAGIDTRFFRFLSAAWLYELGMFIFVLLYNLHLIEIGYREDFLGLVTGAQTAGTLAGAVPAGMLLRRIGMGRMLATAFLLLSVAFMARVVVTEQLPLLVSAFLGGAVMSAFTVAFAPAIARLTREDGRPLGYGIFFSSGVAMGIAGGYLGGRLPNWLSAAPVPGKRSALLVACALLALASVPAFRLHLPAIDHQERHVFPRDPTVWRFLAAIAVWSLAMGAFNPFFNAYFAQHFGAGVERIGAIFAVSQVAQVIAMLCAPLALRRLGLVAGIAFMQVAAGLSLLGLASTSGVAAATGVYVAFIALQWMSEPGMYSVLMKPVPPSQMGAAAALNMMAIMLAQVIAAPVSGMLIARFGYPLVVRSAALLAVVSGVVFWILLRKAELSRTPST